MPTFDFTSPDGKTYSVQGPEGATPAQAFQILQQHLGASAPAAPQEPAAPVTTNNVARSAAEGVPIIGGALNKLDAATNAALAPVLNRFFAPEDQLQEPTFGERYAHSLRDQEGMSKGFEQDHPIVDTGAKLAGGAAAMIPAMAAAPAAFGLTGPTLAGRVAAGAASGGALGGADAAVRGEDITKGAALGAALGGAGPVAGHVVGKVAQGVRDIVSHGAGAEAIPTAEAIKDAATTGYEAIRDLGVTVKPESVQALARDVRTDLRGEGHRDYLSPKTFGVLDELENGSAFTTPRDVAASPEVGSQHAQDVADIRKRFGDEVAAAYDRQQGAAVPAASPAAPKAQSLLEFIASKGGLGPDAELGAIGAEGHTVNVEGAGRRKLVKQGGDTLDYAREAATEAGYLPEGSTPRDFLDAIDGEMRGQKRFPQGFEGHVGKRESAAMSERERAEFDRHMQGFHDDLAEAGHGGLAPDVRARAVKLMQSDGLAADDAVEHALRQLEIEDAAVPMAAGGFPGDRPMQSATPKTPAAAASVSFSDLHGLRRALGKAAQSIDPVEKAAASKAISRLDNYLESIPASDVIGGDAGKAAAMLKEANANYHVAKLAERLQGKISAAELQAASANSGANLENALRQRLKDILKSPKLSQGFNQHEKLAMQRIVRGSASSNTIRALGNILGGGGGIGTLLSGGAGALAGGPVGAVVAPAAGMALKKVGARMTEAQLERLDAMIRSRAPHSEQGKAVMAALEHARADRIAKAGARGAITGGVVNPIAGGVLLDDRRERRR